MPALAHLYEIQPEAAGLYESHVDMLFDFYEGLALPGGPRAPSDFTIHASLGSGLSSKGLH